MVESKVLALVTSWVLMLPTSRIVRLLFRKRKLWI